MSWLKFLTDVIPKIQAPARAMKLHEGLALSQDLAMASMQLLELVEVIERKAGRRFPVEDLFAQAGGSVELTIGKLAAWLEAQAPFGSKKGK